MTRDEARALIERIAAAWPERPWGDVRRREWGTKLLDLDPALAARAFEQLRDAPGGCPSLGDFLGRYAAVRGPVDRHRTPTYEPSPEERDRVRAYIAGLKTQMQERRTARFSIRKDPSPHA